MSIRIFPSPVGAARGCVGQSMPPRWGLEGSWERTAATNMPPRWGLGRIMGTGGCYKHGAPTELGKVRLPWLGQSPYHWRPNQSLDRMTGSAVSQSGRDWRDPGHRSAGRYETGLKVRFRYCRLCAAMT